MKGKLFKVQIQNVAHNRVLQAGLSNLTLLALNKTNGAVF